METEMRGNGTCANPGCGRVAESGSEYCEACELERMLYRRDLRRGDREREGVAVESR